MHEFMLPDLGEGMQEAEIRRWLVQPGDTVKRDQLMVEVETDKAVVEIPSPVAGKVSAIRVPAGTVAKLGEVLVVFDTMEPQRNNVCWLLPPYANGHLSWRLTCNRFPLRNRMVV